ncbi:hypothetical protein H9Q10_11755 [Eikenella sp. S3360]|uniref:Uncharacterized protein n=1 Tax=Eikenella glucosivorans TaxID=2766967 RepID=A0ABS0NDC0_9NEIS|nr:hypothetical protein [Eikenella glucosivorans]MBH5330338.1 hypothetical protein [Eikenella glucosivorans]
MLCARRGVKAALYSKRLGGSQRGRLPENFHLPRANQFSGSLLMLLNAT